MTAHFSVFSPLHQKRLEKRYVHRLHFTRPSNLLHLVLGWLEQTLKSARRRPGPSIPTNPTHSLTAWACVPTGERGGRENGVGLLDG